MIRAPWWTWLVAVALGAGCMALWLRAGSSSGLDELRAAVTRESQRADSLEAVATVAVQRADSATEAHAALAASTDSIIAALTERVQTTTVRAAALGDSLRAMVEPDVAAIVDELEAEWAAALEAEREQTATWRNRALSAEAGWADERLARVAAENHAAALESEGEAQAGLVRALEAEVSRANRDKKIAVIGGLAGVVWGLTK